MDRLPERFDRLIYVDEDGCAGCWLWTGCLTPGGYGRVWFDGKPRAAHRVVYTLLVGPIPDGLQLDHMCRVRRCVNPDHLQAVTGKVNQENRGGPNRDSGSGVLGVSWDRSRGKWRVQVWHENVLHYGGRFEDKGDAERAAVSLRSRLYSNNLADRVSS